MATLQEIRQQYPQYNDMTDQQLADRLYQKFYADMPRQQFDAKVGLQSQESGVSGVDEAGMVMSPKEIGAVQPPPGPSALHSLAVGAQGVGAGVKHAVMAPFDLVAGLQNAATAGVNKLFGTDIPYATPGSVLVDKAVEVAGIPTVEPQSSGERLGYNIADYGTQALALGGGLAAAAPARAAELVSTKVPKVGDAFLRPYFINAPRTVAGDVAAGAGAGAANNYIDEHHVGEGTPYYEPLVRAGATLAGGVAGATGAEAASLTGRAANAGAQRLADVFRGPDPNVPISPTTLKPYTRSQIETAATQAQGMASNPNSAGRTISEQANDFRQNGLQVPSSGLISGDVGLQSAEANARMVNRVPFIENDNKMRAVATEKANTLIDKGADQGAVKKVMETRPAELAAARDAEAMPLLKTAEGSGAVVDAQPVADLLDSKLAEAKRPPVRAALTEARKMLNVPGSDNLDNSVAGLYETRKAINDIIEGRGETPTGRYAKKELLDVRNALDEQIKKASPEFGQYLESYRAGSEPIDLYKDSSVSQRILNGEDPRDTAERIFGGSRYGAENELDQINQLVKADPEAQRGWKAAVSEVLRDKATGLTKIDAGGAGTGETYRVELGKLEKLFKDNETLLTKVFNPEEMNLLRQVHKQLAPLKNANLKALGGSQTAERFGSFFRFFEPIIRTTHGALEGGSIMRKLRVMASLLPSDRQTVQELVNQMWFNPELAKYLLTKDVTSANAPNSSTRLKLILSGAAAGRASGGQN